MNLPGILYVSLEVLNCETEKKQYTLVFYKLYIVDWDYRDFSQYTEHNKQILTLRYGKLFL